MNNTTFGHTGIRVIYPESIGTRLVRKCTRSEGNSDNRRENVMGSRGKRAREHARTRTQIRARA